MKKLFCSPGRPTPTAISADWWVVCAVATALGLGSQTTRAQGRPDIVWQTNGHAANVLSVAFSHDGQLLASGSEDRTAKVWTVPKGNLVTAVFTPPAWMMSVALYSPADLLLTGGDDGAVRAWSISSGMFLYGTSPGGNLVWSIAVARNGSIAISKSDRGINLVSQQGGFILDDDCNFLCDVFSLVFSPDSSNLASSGADGTAKIWRVFDGSLLNILTGHSIVSTNEDDIVINPVYDVDFSPDGVLLVTTGADSTARLWRVSDGAQVRVLQGGGITHRAFPGSSAKFSADGKAVFTLTDGTIKLWRTSDGSLLSTFENTGARRLAVSPDGKYFAYGRGDGTVVLARVPVWIESITEEDGKITLHWRGGSGLYRVQARSHLDKGDWHYLGPVTTNTTFTYSAHSHLFYRVISLPNP